METIQVELDSELLRAANAAAKRVRLNRSALIRQALREHLSGLRTRETEASESIPKLQARLRPGSRCHRGRSDNARRHPPVQVRPLRQAKTRGCAHAGERHWLLIRRHRSAHHQ